MKRMRVAVMLAAVLGVAAGCSADLAGQLVSNEQVRTKVFDTIAANKDLMGQMVSKLTSTDSTRIQLVDQLLANDEVAKQVIVRVGMNPNAIDMVLGVAVQDSAMRGHVMTLLKGMEMASKRAN